MYKKFRNDIQGLRAVAVALVIIYHAKITFLQYHVFPGGFLGVDIFFVISGYLITRIIIGQKNNNKIVSLQQFYLSRIKRILPLFFFVILITLISGYFIFFPDYLRELAKEALSSILFIPNFYFWVSGQVYGEVSGIYKPLLHLWSLGVEIQFYIIYPLFLYFLLKYFPNKINKFLYSFTLIIFFVVVFFFNYNVDFNYYFFPSRSWELLCGSCLAVYELKKKKKFENKTLYNLLTTLAIIIIFYQSQNLKIDNYSPINILPTIISTLIIIGQFNKTTLVYKFLSSKLFVFFGAISYSLYLWHYPVFSFYRFINFNLSTIFEKIFLFFILFIISVITFYLIEEKFRKKFSYKKIFLFLFFIFLFISFFSIKIILKKGFVNYFDTEVKNIKINRKLQLELATKCQPFYIIEDCVINGNQNKKIYFVGDSILESYLYGIAKQIEHRDFSIITRIGCMYIYDFDLINTKTNQTSNKCSSNDMNNLKNEIKENKDSVVILGARYSQYTNRNEYKNEITQDNGKLKLVHNKREKNIEQGIVDSIQDLLENNIKVILIYPTPEMTFLVPQELLISTIIKKITFSKEPIILSIDREIFRKKNENILKVFDKMKHINLFKIFPEDYFCNKNKCFANDLEEVFYYDEKHPVFDSKITKKINDNIINLVEKILN